MAKATKLCDRHEWYGTSLGACPDCELESLRAALREAEDNLKQRTGVFMRWMEVAQEHRREAEAQRDDWQAKASKWMLGQDDCCDTKRMQCCRVAEPEREASSG